MLPFSPLSLFLSLSFCLFCLSSSSPSPFYLNYTLSSGYSNFSQGLGVAGIAGLVPLTACGQPTSMILDAVTGLVYMSCVGGLYSYNLSSTTTATLDMHLASACPNNAYAVTPVATPPSLLTTTSTTATTSAGINNVILACSAANVMVGVYIITGMTQIETTPPVEVSWQGPAGGTPLLRQAACLNENPSGPNFSYYNDIALTSDANTTSQVYFAACPGQQLLWVMAQNVPAHSLSLPTCTPIALSYYNAPTLVSSIPLSGGSATTASANAQLGVRNGAIIIGCSLGGALVYTGYNTMQQLISAQMCASVQMVVADSVNNIIYVGCDTLSTVFAVSVVVVGNNNNYSTSSNATINVTSITTLIVAPQACVAPRGMAWNYTIAPNMLFFACYGGGVMQLNTVSNQLLTLIPASQCMGSLSPALYLDPLLSSRVWLYVICNSGGGFSLVRVLVTSSLTAFNTALASFSTGYPVAPTIALDPVSTVLYYLTPQGVGAIHGSRIVPLLPYSPTLCASAPTTLTFNTVWRLLFVTCRGPFHGIGAPLSSTIVVLQWTPSTTNVIAQIVDGSPVTTTIENCVWAADFAVDTNTGQTFVACGTSVWTITSSSSSSASSSSSLSSLPLSNMGLSMSLYFPIQCGQASGATLTTTGTNVDVNAHVMNINWDPSSMLMYTACQGGAVVTTRLYVVNAASNSIRFVNTNSFNGHPGNTFSALLIDTSSSVMYMETTTGLYVQPLPLTTSWTLLVPTPIARNNGLVTFSASVGTLLVSSANPSSQSQLYNQLLSSVTLSSTFTSVTGIVSYQSPCLPQFTPATTGIAVQPSTGVMWIACASDGIIYAQTNRIGCTPGFEFGAVFAGCTPCRSGSAGDGTGACQLCQPGTYALSGASICAQCQPGTYASSPGSDNCTSTVAGRYVNISGASTATLCPPGTGSPPPNALGLYTTCEPCQAGHFCPAGSPSTTNSLCGSRSVFCPAGSSSPIVAGAGNFTVSIYNNNIINNNSSNNNNTAVNSTSMYTDTMQTDQQPCAPGSFCVNGVSALCPLGSYSGIPMSSSCSPCSGGSAAPFSGLIKCYTCPAGYFCPSGSSSLTSLPCSSPLVYCPSGSSAPLPVPSGSFSTPVGVALGQSGYSNCTAGSYCVGGVQTPCPVGTFSVSSSATSCVSCSTLGSGLTSSSNSTTCAACLPGSFLPPSAVVCTPTAAGYYSSSYGSVSATPCPGGVYGSSAGLNSSACTALCPAGYYCPSPSVSYNLSLSCNSPPSFCPLGSFSPTIVKAGHYSTPISGPLYTDVQICPIGSYCQNGVSALCPQSTYANTTGMSVCTSCVMGTTTTSIGASTCSQCGPGFYLPPSSLICVPTPAGYYTPISGLSAPLPCPASTYGERISLNTSTCSGPCAAGYFCPPASLSPYAMRCGAPSLYCPPSSAVPIPAVSGTQTIDGNVTDMEEQTRSKITACTPGNFCVNGVSSTCPPGTYSSTFNSSSCSSCPPGYMAQNLLNFSSFFSSFSSSSLSSFLSSSVNVSNTNSNTNLSSVIVGATNCVPCSSGFYLPLGALSCYPCRVGRYVNVSAATACTSCTVGRYADTENMTQCKMALPGYTVEGTGAAVSTPCLPGYFSNTSGSSSCTACPPFSYTPYTSSTVCFPCSTDTQSASYQCSQCQPGSYQGDNSQCKPCPAGSHSTKINAQTCDMCPAGTYSLSSYADCVVCTSGSYSSSFGSSACSLCPAGQYSAGNVTACTAATPGFYTIFQGASAPLPCLPGFYNPFFNATSCLPCALGSFSTSSNSTSCSLSLPGHYVSSLGQSSQLVCTPGTFSNVSGMSLCMNCPKFTVQPQVQAVSCQPCPTADVEGAITCPTCGPGSFIVNGTCQRCSPGSYTNIFNQTACTLCAPGSYTPYEASSNCIPCGLGSYSADIGRINSCDQCRDGKASLASLGSTGCQTCQPGFYGDATIPSSVCHQCQPGTYTFKSESKACDPCAVTGITCPNNQNETIVVSAGYWGYVTPSLELAVLPCPASICLNGTLGSQCAYGRPNENNPLCGQCLPGFSEWGGHCLDCRAGTNGGMLFLFLLLAVLYVIFLHVSSQSAVDNVLGVFLYFAQTTLLIVGPNANLLAWLQLFNFAPQSIISSSSSSSSSTPTPTPCPMQLDAYSQMGLSLLTPVIFLFILVCIAAVHSLISTAFITTDVEGRVLTVLGNLSFITLFNVDPYVRSATALGLFCYTLVAETVLSYLYCVDNGTGTHVVFSHPAVECSSSSYVAWLPLIILELVFYVAAVPILIAIFLFKKRTYFARSKSTTKMARFHARFGLLFESFSPSSFWWQIVILLRRVICVVLAIYINTSLQWRMFCFFVVHFVSLFAQQSRDPYSSVIENRFESASLVILCIISVLVTAEPPPYPDNWFQVVLSTVVIVTLIGFGVVWLYIKGGRLCNKQKSKAANDDDDDDNVNEKKNKINLESSSSSSSSSSKSSSSGASHPISKPVQPSSSSSSSSASASSFSSSSSSSSSSVSVPREVDNHQPDHDNDVDNNDVHHLQVPRSQSVGGEATRAGAGAVSAIELSELLQAAVATASSNKRNSSSKEHASPAVTSSDWKDNPLQAFQTPEQE